MSDCWEWPGVRHKPGARPPTVVSLFSGCGGLDLGLERAGFLTTAMVEIMPFATATLRENFPSADVVGPPDRLGDVRKVDVAELGSNVDLLAGGPPCQSFSIAAAQRFLKGDVKFKRTGFDDEARGNLVFEYLRLLAGLMPKVFMIENVPGLRDLDGGQTLDSIVAVATGLGYKVAEPTVIQAADFGVPQFRRRLIVVGALDELPVLPVPTHSAKGGLFARPYTSVAQALWELPADAANHVPREHLATSVARYRTLSFSQREHLGRVDRLSPYRPSKTVIAGGSNGGGRSHLHPYLARTLTVRECARLQTFPDSFEFEGTMSRQFTQVGNAVPPLLGEVLGRAIGAQFFGLGYEGQPTLAVERSAPETEVADAALLDASQDDPDLLYEDVRSRLFVGDHRANMRDAVNKGRIGRNPASLANLRLGPAARWSR